MSNHRQDANRRSGGDFQAPSNEELKQIITDPGAAELLVTWADRIGGALAEQRLTTSQIRSIFSEVRRIEADWGQDSGRASRNLILLKPKMAYRARKERGKGVEELVSVLSPAVDLVDQNEQNFRNFVDFFEAILAYHKSHGGN